MFFCKIQGDYFVICHSFSYEPGFDVLFFVDIIPLNLSNGASYYQLTHMVFRNKKDHYFCPIVQDIMLLSLWLKRSYVRNHMYIAIHCKNADLQFLRG